MQKYAKKISPLVSNYDDWFEITDKNPKKLKGKKFAIA